MRKKSLQLFMGEIVILGIIISGGILPLFNIPTATFNEDHNSFNHVSLASSGTQELTGPCGFGVTQWSKLGDNITFDFTTSPFTNLEIWAMTEKQWFDSHAGDPKGIYMGTYAVGEGVFYPQHEAKWYIVFILESGTTMLTYIVEATPCIIITQPTSDTSIRSGGELQIKWKSHDIDGGVKIELFKGSTYFTTLKELTLNDGIEYCTIPQSCTDGTDYKIKIIATSLGESFGEFDFSDPFTIATTKINVFQPYNTDVLIPHTTRKISWWGIGAGPKVRIDLFVNSTFIREIINETENDDVQLWTVWQGEELSNLTDTHYRIRVQSVNNPTVFGFSPKFTITNEKFLLITNPIGNSTYYSGQVINITWNTDAPCDEVSIELIEGSQSSHQIAVADNTGQYRWTVPLGVKYSSDYQISIRAVDNSTWDVSDPFTLIAGTISGYDLPIVWISIMCVFLVALSIRKKYNKF